MVLNVNCLYCGKFYQCEHPKQRKLLAIFKKKCGFVSNVFYKCNLQKLFPKPTVTNIG